MRKQVVGYELLSSANLPCYFSTPIILHSSQQEWSEEYTAHILLARLRASTFWGEMSAADILPEICKDVDQILSNAFLYMTISRELLLASMISAENPALPMPPHEPNRHGYYGQRNSNRPIDPEVLRNNPGLLLRLISWCKVEKCSAKQCLMMIST